MCNFIHDSMESQVIGTPIPRIHVTQSVDLAMQSLHHKVCSQYLWQNSM
jgi:hypothetical protein